MLSVTQTFKDNLHGPKTWRVQLSSVESTWASMTWQDAPVNAEFVRPFGSIQQQTEDPQPFSFVGPDMQLTARNTAGFWTNAAGTGRLDTGATVYVRVQTSVTADGNYITLIQGPVDLATISKQAGDIVSFTVRGTLNALDYQLATEQCANRKFASYGVANGTLFYQRGCPVKFCDMISITPGGGPDGCYKLAYDSKDKSLSFDNGTAVKLLPNDGIEFALDGESGAHIGVLWNSGGSMTFTGLPDKDIEAWIVMRRTSTPGPNGSVYWALYDCSPVSTLAEFKQKLSGVVDLETSSIPVLTLSTPDPSVFQHCPGSDLYPSAIVGIGERTWLMSSWSGTYKGIWKVMVSDDPMQLVSFAKISDSVACYMKKIGTTHVVALCDISTNNDEFTYKSFLSDGSAGVSVFDIATLTETKCLPFSGSAALAWKSFDAISITTAYGVLITTGTSGKINEIDIPGKSVTVKGNAFAINGPSMIPGCVIDTPDEDFYVCIAGSYDANDKAVYYAHGWHITNSLYSAALLDITYNRSELIGPVGISSSFTETEVQGSVENPAGVIVLFDKLSYSDVDFTLTRHTAVGGDVWVVNFSSNDATFVYGAVHPEIYGLACTNSLFYCGSIWNDQTGKTLVWTSGDNIGESKAILAHTNHTFVVGPFGNTQTIMVSKMTFSTPFTYKIDARDSFKIYGADVVLSATVSTKVDELNGTTYLHGEIGHVDGAYYEPSSYMVYNNTYLRKEVVGTQVMETIYAWDILGWKKRKIMDIYGPSYGMVPHVFKKQLSGSTLAQVATSDRPWGGAKDTDGRALVVGRYMMTFINTGGTSQYRQVSANDFSNKTVREAIEEVATACNAYIFPSEHNKRLTLQYRGTSPEQQGGILRSQYHYDGEWMPRLPVDLLTLDRERRGRILADKFGQTLDITSPQTHPSNRKSLANDIWDYLSQSRRWHRIIGDWLIWHEPGDAVPLWVDDETAKDCMVISTETDPEGLTHTMTLLEDA